MQDFLEFVGDRPDGNELVHNVSCYTEAAHTYLKYAASLGEVERISLLDVVAFWLQTGNAVEACGSFEIYLVTVISIIASWADLDFQDQVKNINYAWSGVIDNESPKYRVFNESMEIAGMGASAWQHPALSRTAWDMAVVKRHREYPFPVLVDLT
ncbi:hypothetical protein AXK59_23655 [Tsukamurella tyrosinosolvens]|nr:hypothetical protein AXK59_23655 [Tsukamurella tyrosinosolvens]